MHKRLNLYEQSSYFFYRQFARPRTNLSNLSTAQAKAKTYSATFMLHLRNPPRLMYLGFDCRTAVLKNLMAEPSLPHKHASSKRSASNLTHPQYNHAKFRTETSCFPALSQTHQGFCPYAGI